MQHSQGNGIELLEQASAPESLAQAIVRTVAYVDVFDYPLTAQEVCFFLIGMAASEHEVNALLRQRPILDGRLSFRDGFFTLPGREHIVEVRRHRAQIAASLWPTALHYGRRMAAMPFSRMVAVTGSLAVDNVTPDADIDYLVVTESDRLWVNRAFIILLVRLAAQRGCHLCPNYFLSERAMVFHDRNLYTAHELVQMVPIAGNDVYDRLRTLNDWTSVYLPNAIAAPRTWPRAPQRRVLRALKRSLESGLRTPIGGWLEGWEMRRKMERFQPEGASVDVEAAFCPDWCKGHFEGHGQRIIRAYEQRMSNANAPLHKQSNGATPRL